MDDTTSDPLRPGDPIPAGGIDPSQVFSSSSGGSMQDDSTGDDSNPPQDTSPPPPPIGVTATLEMGYDEEDLKILAQVGDYRYGVLIDQVQCDGIPIPEHTTEFDTLRFLHLLCGSISLTRDEKWRIVQAIPQLSQFQIDELQKILEEERQKFSELSPKHLSQLRKLEEKACRDWEDLQVVTDAAEQKADEEMQAEEIRKQLGL